MMPVDYERKARQLERDTYALLGERRKSPPSIGDVATPLRSKLVDVLALHTEVCTYVLQGKNRPDKHINDAFDSLDSSALLIMRELGLFSLDLS